MRIPFQRAAKSMKNADKARNKVFTFVHFVEHFKNNATDCLEKTVKKRTVFEKEMAELFVNSKNAVAMSALN
jgi:hypothetical protein